MCVPASVNAHPFALKAHFMKASDMVHGIFVYNILNVIILCQHLNKEKHTMKLLSC